MKKFIFIAIYVYLLCGCSTLTYQERNTLVQLEKHGITIDRPVGNWQKPADPGIAGMLNILPGCGNFYLATGNGADSSHYLYGAMNLLFWPVSIIWGIPEAMKDANIINQRELVYYYTFDEIGIEDLKQRGYKLNTIGQLEKIK